MLNDSTIGKQRDLRLESDYNSKHGDNMKLDYRHDIHVINCLIISYTTIFIYAYSMWIISLTLSNFSRPTYKPFSPTDAAKHARNAVELC